jgi:hypothetical protein
MFNDYFGALTRMPEVLTKGFCGFPWSLQNNFGMSSHIIHMPLLSGFSKISY